MRVEEKASPKKDSSTASMLGDAVLGIGAFGIEYIGDANKAALIKTLAEKNQKLGRVEGALFVAPFWFAARGLELVQNTIDADGDAKKALSQTANDYVLGLGIYYAVPGASTPVAIAHIVSPFTDKLADAIERRWPISSDLNEVGSEDMQALLRIPGFFVALEGVVKDSIMTVKDGVLHGIQQGSVSSGTLFIYEKAGEAISNTLRFLEPVEAPKAASSTQIPSSSPSTPSASPVVIAPTITRPAPTSPQFGASIGLDQNGPSFTVAAQQTNVSEKIDSIGVNARVFPTGTGGVGVAVSGKVDISGGTTLILGGSSAGAKFISGSIALSSAGAAILAGTLVAIGGTIWGSVRHIHKKREAHQIPFLDYKRQENKDLSLAIYNLSKRSLSSREVLKFQKDLSISRRSAKTPEELEVLQLLSDMIVNPTPEIKSALKASYSDDKYKRLNAEDFLKLYEINFNRDAKSFEEACKAGNLEAALADCESLIRKYPSNPSLIEAKHKLEEVQKHLLISSPEEPLRQAESTTQVQESRAIEPSESLKAETAEVLSQRALESSPIKIKVTMLNGHKAILDYFDENAEAIRANPELLKNFEALLSLEVMQAAKNSDFTKINEIQARLGADFPALDILCKIEDLNGQLHLGLAIESMAALAFSCAQQIEEETSRKTAVAACGLGEMGGKVIAGIAEYRLLVTQQNEKLSRELSFQEISPQRKAEIESKLVEINGQYGILSNPRTYYVLSSIIDTLKKYHKAVNKIDPEEEGEYDKYWDSSSTIASIAGLVFDFKNWRGSPSTIRAAAKIAEFVDKKTGNNLNLSESSLVTMGLPTAITATENVSTLYSQPVDTSAIQTGTAALDATISLAAIGTRLSAMAIEKLFLEKEIAKLIEKGEYLSEDDFVSLEATCESAKKTADQVNITLFVKSAIVHSYIGLSWAGAAVGYVLPASITSAAGAAAAATGAAATATGSAIVSVLPASVTWAAGVTAAAAGTAATTVGAAVASIPAAVVTGGAAFVLTGLVGVNAGYAQVYLNTRNILINIEIATNKGDYLLALQKLEKLEKRIGASAVLEEKRLSLRVKQALTNNPAGLLALESEIIRFLEKNPEATLLNPFLQKCQEYRHSINSKATEGEGLSKKVSDALSIVGLYLSMKKKPIRPSSEKYGTSSASASSPYRAASTAEAAQYNHPLVFSLPHYFDMPPRHYVRPPFNLRSQTIFQHRPSVNTRAGLLGLSVMGLGIQWTPCLDH